MMTELIHIRIDPNERRGYEAWSRDTPGIRGFGENRLWAFSTFIYDYCREIPISKLSIPFVIEDTPEELESYILSAKTIFTTTDINHQYLILENAWNIVQVRKW